MTERHERMTDKGLDGAKENFDLGEDPSDDEVADMMDELDNLKDEEPSDNEESDNWEDDEKDFNGDEEE